MNKYVHITNFCISPLDGEQYNEHNIISSIREEKKTKLTLVILSLVNTSSMTMYFFNHVIHVLTIEVDLVHLDQRVVCRVHQLACHSTRHCPRTKKSKRAISANLETQQMYQITPADTSIVPSSENPWITDIIIEILNK
jgi:hypothetical protein